MARARCSVAGAIHSVAVAGVCPVAGARCSVARAVDSVTGAGCSVGGAIHSVAVAGAHYSMVGVIHTVARGICSVA